MFEVSIILTDGEYGETYETLDDCLRYLQDRLEGTADIEADQVEEVRILRSQEEEI